MGKSSTVRSYIFHTSISYSFVWAYTHWFLPCFTLTSSHVQYLFFEDVQRGKTHLSFINIGARVVVKRYCKITKSHRHIRNVDGIFNLYWIFMQNGKLLPTGISFPFFFMPYRLCVVYGLWLRLFSHFVYAPVRTGHLARERLISYSFSLYLYSWYSGLVTLIFRTFLMLGGYKFRVVDGLYW